MTSQYDKLKVKIDRYKQSPFADSRVIASLERRLNFANTVDPDIESRVDKILSED